MSGIHPHLRAVVLFALTAISGLAGPAQAGGEGLCDLPCGFEVTEVFGPVIPPLGQMNLTIRAVNAAGVAVGDFEYLTGSGNPCTWTEAGGIVAIPKPPEVGFGQAVGINNNGWIIANASSPVGPRGWVLIPHEAGYTWVPLAPASSGGHTFVGGINDLNQVVGWRLPGGGLPHRSFFWSIESGFVDIIPEGWMSSRCTDINNHGVICGNVSMQFAADPGVHTVRAFTLDGGTLTVIDPPAPYTMSEARRINDNGVVVGNVLIPGGGGVEWQSAGMLHTVAEAATTVFPPPPGYDYVSLQDLNEANVASGHLKTDVQFWSWNPAVSCGNAVVDITQGLPPSLVNVASYGYAIDDAGRVFAKCNGPQIQIYSPAPDGADLNCDGLVGPDDLGVLIAAWGASGAADLDGDGVIGGRDLGLLLAAWTF